MRRRFSLFVLTLILGPLAILAQDVDPYEEGVLAFREGRYEAARDALERATKADPGDAEAYFLLARLYFETPLRDTRQAGKLLDEALEIEPENVQYLVARLEQMRVESWNFFTEKTRERRRRELAISILKLDADNAFAHEELGEAYIRDFWRYRNAFMYPTLKFGAYDYRQRFETDPFAAAFADQLQNLEVDLNLDPGELTQNRTQGGGFGGIISPDQVFLADNFDVETLQDQGVPVQDLSRRAQKAYDRAIGHLQASIEADPRRESVYDHLMRIYALKGEWEGALDMLQEMYVFFPESERLWMYLGLAHYKVANMDAAAKAYESSFTYMNPETQDAFTRLDEILPIDEREKYRADQVAYAARFWMSKDPRFLTPYNERKIEHYSRLVYADLLYGAPKIDLRGWNTERGNILVRYGLPQSDVTLIPKSTSRISEGMGISDEDPRGENSAGGQTTSSETLRRGFEGTDFDMLSEANTFNIWDYGEFKFVFEDPFRNGEYRLYSPSAAEIADGSLPWQNDYTIKAKETFRKTPERYEYEAPGRQVEMPYLVTAFKGANGQTDLYVNFGVPITEYDQGQSLIDLTANTGTFLINDNRDILVERRSTIYGLATEQIVSFAEQNLWIDSQQMLAPPGQHEISVEFETASGNTVAVQRRSIEVPQFHTDRLALSDLLLGYSIEETPDGKPLTKADIVRDGLSILPAPWSVFSHRQPIYLYFEVYNLTQGDAGRTDYEMEAVLVPKEEDGRVGRFVKNLLNRGGDGVSVRLPGAGVDADEGQYLILDAANQEPGLYTLVLKVRDNVTGREVESEQDLFLE